MKWVMRPWWLVLGVLMIPIGIFIGLKYGFLKFTITDTSMSPQGTYDGSRVISPTT